jgi:type IV secretion system protein TrbE
MTSVYEIFRPYEQSGALHNQIPVQEAIDNLTFLTKAGHLVQMLRLDGLDDECLDPNQVEYISARVESALRLLDEDFRLYQYLIKTPAKPVESAKSEAAVVQEALANRAAYLNSQPLSEIKLYWALVYEGGQLGKRQSGLASLVREPSKVFQALFSEKKAVRNLEAELTRSRQILAQRVAGLVVQLQDVVKLKILDKQGAYLVLRQLMNFAPHKVEGPALGYDQFVDSQVCDSALECHRDHLRLDHYRVKVLTLKEPPPYTSAHLFRRMEAVRGNFIIATEWRREGDARMRSTIQSKRRHFFNLRASLFNYVGKETPRPEEMLINEGTAALVRDLGDAQRELEVSGHHFGQFSITIVVYGEDLDEVRRTSTECYKVYAAQGAHLTEESYNLLNAFFSIQPGNSAFNLRRLWLSSANAADLSLVFAPSQGEVRNDFLNAESLATLETCQGSLYGLNLHYGDVPHALVLGSTGSGKSFFLCFLLTQIQKYSPLTFIFDLGGSYRSLTSLLGGTYLRIGRETQGISINPFCLPPTNENLQFLFAFVRVLVESSGYQLRGEDERDLYSQLENLYQIYPEERRLRTLAHILNRPLGEALGKWIETGQYGRVFDNAEDNLTFARFQAFDFEGMEKSQELLEPLLFYILHRASGAVYDPANITTLKVFVVDETWRFFKNQAIRAYILEALKTWRKKNAAMILATQSSDDLLRSEMLASVVESCPTKFFLANPDMDTAKYSEIFHLNRAEAEAIRSLTPKKELLLKRPDFAKILCLNVDPKSFWLYTTNPFDNHRRQEVFDRFGLQKGLEILAKKETTP